MYWTSVTGLMVSNEIVVSRDPALYSHSYAFNFNFLTPYFSVQNTAFSLKILKAWHVSMDERTLRNSKILLRRTPIFYSYTSAQIHSVVSHTLSDDTVHDEFEFLQVELDASGSARRSAALHTYVYVCVYIVKLTYTKTRWS